MRARKLGAWVVGAIAAAALAVPASAPAGILGLSGDPTASTALGGADAPTGERDPRIVGGRPTSIARWPWQAAIVLNSARFGGNDLQRQFCGASLIHPSIVLTAAHCVFDTDPDCTLSPGPGACLPADFAGGDGTTALDPNDAEIVLGKTRLSGGGGSRHAIGNIHIHPSYDPLAVANDIALISLQTPSGRPRVRLAGPRERILWGARRPAFPTGWGHTSEAGSKSDLLREVQVQIVSDARCRSDAFYGGFFRSAVMVCAGLTRGMKDACQGDSGGPLHAPALRGVFRQVGVTSFGLGCARPRKPGVYARVAENPLRGFVQAKVSEIETAENLPAKGISVIGSGARPHRCAGKLITWLGSNGPDVAVGDGQRDVFLARGGNDRLFGRGGNDLFCAGGGNDRVFGGPGRDTVFGGRGRDRIFGGRGNDRLFGGPGRDALFGGPGRDLLVGGPGRDRCVGGPGRDRIRRC